MSIQSRGISSTVTCRGLGKGGGGTALFGRVASLCLRLTAQYWKASKQKGLNLMGLTVSHKTAKNLAVRGKN